MTVYLPGQPGYVEPGSPEHRLYMTPSKVATVLGISRWNSPYRLWHELKGIVDPEPTKDAFDIGHDAEPFAANRWLRKNPGWHLSAGEVQFHVPDGHFPFPAMATIDRRASRGRWRRVVEFKIARNLTDLETFGDDLTGDAPEDYAAQIVAQRLFVAAAQPGAAWLPTSHLLVLGPYFNERMYDIEWDANVASYIISECEQFWRSLQGDIAPDLDDKKATYLCLKEQHPDIDRGDVANIDPGLAVDYLAGKSAEKTGKAVAQGVTNRMLAAMGRSQYAKVGEITVADRRNNGKGGVALYAGQSATEEKIRQMAGADE